jgi:hypothetical protein
MAVLGREWRGPAWQGKARQGKDELMTCIQRPREGPFLEPYATRQGWVVG